MMFFISALLHIMCCCCLTLSFHRKVFIDFGANNGESVNAFLGMKRHNRLEQNGGRVSVELLRASGETKVDDGKSIFSDNLEWDIIVFEANPNHTPALLAQQQQHLLETNTVRSYKLYNGTAISTKRGQIPFIFDNTGSGDAGSTIMSESHSAIGTKIMVRSVGITHFFHRHQFTVDDYVVVKMDVEGAEYDLINRILETGLMKYIDKIAVEWHHNAHEVFGKPHPNEFPEPVQSERMQIYHKYKGMYDEIMAKIASSPTPQDINKFVLWE